MDVVFERTGQRSYTVEVRRSDEPVLRMDPAPGFDRWCPHDLMHLVVEELFTNMVRHNEGGSDQITVSIERLDNSLHLELIDTDVEDFDPATADTPAVDAGIEERRPGGLGIYLVKKMVDDLSYDYEAEDRRMRVTVTKTLEN